LIPIYIATLIQNFEFSVADEKMRPSREPEVGVSLSPKEFEARITPRK
jgi:hypothetical protein